MSFVDSNISNKQIIKILNSSYGISGKIMRLDGEIDFNYKITDKKNHSYLLKISRPKFNPDYIDYQLKILEHLSKQDEIKTSTVLPTLDHKKSFVVKDKFGEDRSIILCNWIDGRLWSKVNPKTKTLREDLGSKNSLITRSLLKFKHSFSKRKIDWDIANSLWVEEYIPMFKNEEKEIAEEFIKSFKERLDDFNKLKKSIIHNDINDNNIIVSNNLKNPKVESIIDFGDSVFSQTINDLAITCAYAIMDLNDPLTACLDVVRGFNKNLKINDSEIKLLYNLIGIRLIISVTKSLINRKKEPENKYLLISEKSAWSLLKKWRNINSEFAYYSFRKACSLDAIESKIQFENWAKKNKFSFKDLFPKEKKSKVFKIDLSIGSKWIGGREEIEDLKFFEFKINRLQEENPKCLIAGGYLEPRPIYSSSSYDKIGNQGSESRTIHLGVDFWLPAGTQVSSIFDGEVFTAVNDAGDKEYGGLIIIKHKTKDFSFFTLYGHNTARSVLKNKVGSKVKKGDIIAEIASFPENGNWASHLHFQVILSMLDYKNDFPGVCYHNQLDLWKDLCPDPNLLFKCSDLNQIKIKSDSELINFRKKHLGKSLKLHYDTPLHIVRGEGVYLIDQNGKKYLDTINNVAHVGHEEVEIVTAGKNQMSILNTNSRYLHSSINELTNELLSTLPKKLNVVHFVNSGSEANEIAVRMMKTHTNSNNIIVSQYGYHGNTNICVDISSYKFDGKGGKGAPKNTHVISIPSKFNLSYKENRNVDFHIKELEECIQKIKSQNKKLGGFIIEPIISCGGQVELPKGYLKKAYKIIRENGGICISDEVQVGCGRVGKKFWGFQLHDVIPDIITIGKPLGNGHPIGAVVCTSEIAESFANGMEFFNTFGGNPVSCSIANQVLKKVKKNKLQKNSFEVGNYLKNELKKLSKKYKIIKDVRGEGLFLGIEFLDTEMNPLENETKYIVNRLKDYGILSSYDGPNNNVIKIKPPIIFSKSNCDYFVKYLDKILKEDYVFI